MRVAVIPARGGSKRIPRKNVKPFCGRPMIAWAISAAESSACFDRILVSTDDDEIAEVARSLGAEVPFKRPSELSGDHTPTVPVIAHAVDWLARGGTPALHVCCVYATAALITAEDLKAGLQKLREGGFDYVFTAARFPAPVERAFRLAQDETVRMISPEHYATRSQDLVPAYYDAGQFYWGRADAWLALKPVFSARATVLELPASRVQDIDTAQDWQRAELLFRLQDTRAENQ
jgi:pseudaminic acid cytidylyltransferase